MFAFLSPPLVSHSEEQIFKGLAADVGFCTPKTDVFAYLVGTIKKTL